MHEKGPENTRKYHTTFAKKGQTFASNEVNVGQHKIHLSIPIVDQVSICHLSCFLNMYMYFTQLVRFKKSDKCFSGWASFILYKLSYYGLIKWKIIECTQIPNAPFILKTNNTV